MTELDIYEPPAAVEPYRAALAMTPEQAKALDDQVRQCTKAVLRPGTDYGIIPGTGGDQVLFKPGAEKLLQWFGFAYRMECLDIERDDEGRKQGATYRCTVVKRLPGGAVAEVATCEGYAGYDEAKFFQTDEDAQFKAEARERGWAAKDKRPPNPNKWKNITGYRAPWNTIIKMAQKRALVGAAIVATSAGGLFGTEEDERSPVADDGSTWYEQAIETALTSADQAALSKLYTEAGQAHRDGLCSRAQQDHVQNAAKRRLRVLAQSRPAAVEDLGRQEATPPAADARPESPQGLRGRVQGHMKRLGYAVDDTDRDERMRILNRLARTSYVASTSDFDDDELKAIADALGRCRDRAALEALAATGEAVAHE